MSSPPTGDGGPAHRWDPQAYLRYQPERSRPFHDLLARIEAVDPRYVVDLGCGPGNLTEVLSQRWPDALVEGVDSSPEMLAATDSLARPGRLEFTLGDLRDWTPSRPVDVLLTNATLQWVPGHLELLPRLVGHLAADGWLGLQVPGNYTEPSHVILDQLQRDPRFAPYLAALPVPSAHGPAAYLEVLAGQGCLVDAWETTNLHLLDGPDPVLRWAAGTRARPVLDALPDDLRPVFEREYAAALRVAYPARDYGTVLPFRRVFAVAHRTAYAAELIRAARPPPG